MFCKQDDFLDNIPKSPRRPYKDTGWKGWGDWLGYIGNGMHCWHNSSIIIFLESLKHELINLESIDLITIINSNNLANKIKELGRLEDLVSSEPDSEQRKIIIEDLTLYFKDQEEDVGQEEENHEKSEIKTLFSEQLKDADTSKELDLTERTESHLLEHGQADFDFLHMLDTKMMSASLDDENLDFLMKNQLKRLWNEILNKIKSIDALSKEKGGKNFTLLKGWFFQEYRELSSFDIPDDYHFVDENGKLLPPNLMQRLTTLRLLKEKSYGNWSGTGAGKTLSAVFSGRLAGAKNTLIICNNATVKGWIESINQYFANSHVFIKQVINENEIDPSQYNVVNRHDIHLPVNQFNYLVLNYETFQQEDAENIVFNLLENNKIDYVILDEVQNVKQREVDKESIRRNNVNKLIIHARDKNPDLYCMVMSATPIINNLYEPKALIEMLTGLEWSDLDTKENVPNGIEMYKALTRYGLRYTPIYDLELTKEVITIDGTHLVDDLIGIKKGAVLEFEIALLSAKLDAIKKYIKPGTLIYTHYVTEMAKPIGEYIENLGFTVGYYMGDDKSGLEAFKAKKVDVLVGSSPISTGVDGIQKVCNTLIPICLPWTSAEYKQLEGRIYRQGSKFEKVFVYIPQVKIDIDDGQWSWDKKRYNIIKYKATLADLVLDGRIPKSLLPSKSKMVAEAQEELEKWVNRIKSGDVITFEREKLTIPLNPVQIDYQKKKLGDFSEINKEWSIQHSSTTHKKLTEHPEDWFYYHTLYSQKRKEWPEIPYEEIAKKIVRDEFVVADLGCGENLLKEKLSNKVLSFDHVAIDDSVTACDISNIPLGNELVDVAVLSLAMMGSNSRSYISEAFRILRRMSTVIIAEPKTKWEGRLNELTSILEDVGFTKPSIEKTTHFLYLQSFKP
jgi:superfamily II DNA or RNA helicase